MAEDARISTEFPGHYKTKKVRRRLGIEGCWHLMCLFLWCAGNRPEGDLTGMSDEDIEIACGWEGKVGELVSVLCEVGYIEGEAEHRVIHEWAEHNTYVATRSKRVAASKRANSIRWERRLGQQSDSDSDSNRSPVSSEAEKSALPSSPLLSSPPKEEKPLSNENLFDGAKASTQEADSVTQVWNHYLARTGRKEKLYSFTAARKRKGLARLRECLTLTGGDYSKAVELMNIAVDALTASDWHMGRDPTNAGKKYIDWIDNLFDSKEKLEKWWQRNDSA